jgi:hypothetical protein
MFVEQNEGQTGHQSQREPTENDHCCTRLGSESDCHGLESHEQEVRITLHPFAGIERQSMTRSPVRSVTQRDEGVVDRPQIEASCAENPQCRRRNADRERYER